MKSLLISGPIVLAITFAACKRPAGSASSTPAPASPAPPIATAPATTTTTPEAKPESGGAIDSEVAAAQREKFAAQLATALALVRQHKIPAALAELEKIPEEFHTDAEFLNLRGCCHIEERDFEAALKDLQEADKKMPGSPDIRFNIAEIYFVTDRWDEAMREFQLVKSSPGPNADTLQALIAFKLMLCEEGRGNANEFDRLAAANLKDADTLLGSYTKAAIEFRDGKKDDAKATLAGAARKFPKPADRAPWHDTMIEFGYDPR